MKLHVRVKKIVNFVNFVVLITLMNIKIIKTFEANINDCLIYYTMDIYMHLIAHLR